MTAKVKDPLNAVELERLLVDFGGHFDKKLLVEKSQLVSDGFVQQARSFLSMSRNYIERHDKNDRGKAAIALVTALAFTISRVAEEFAEHNQSLTEIGLFQLVAGALDNLEKE